MSLNLSLSWKLFQALHLLLQYNYFLCIIICNCNDVMHSTFTLGTLIVCVASWKQVELCNYKHSWGRCSEEIKKLVLDTHEGTQVSLSNEFWLEIVYDSPNGNLISCLSFFLQESLQGIQNFVQEKVTGRQSFWIILKTPRGRSIFTWHRWQLSTLGFYYCMFTLL